MPRDTHSRNAPRWLATVAATLLMMAASSLGRMKDGEPETPYAVTAPKADQKVDPFYKKQVDLRGLPVQGSDAVNDFALKEAAYLIDRMLSDRPDILKALVDRKARFVVMAATERTTDLPEQRDMTPKDFWDVRARGLGASRRKPIVSCGEENLLNLRGDPYNGENILIHEFSHAIHGLALRDLDPTFDRRLRETYDKALARSLWQGTYAATNPGEYWAEGVQSWFDCNLSPPDFQHNDVHTREALKAYDPGVAALVAEVFGDKPWRYVPPRDRKNRDQSHLAGFDPEKAAAFSWGAEEKKKYDEVVAEKRQLRKREQERNAPPKP